MAKQNRKKKKATSEPAIAATETAPAVVEAKHRGRKSQYSNEQRAAFLEAVKNGRTANAPWKEIYDAVKAQGFKGSLQYLTKMASQSGLVKTSGGRGRPKGSKNAAKMVTAKRGRPKGSGKRARPIGSTVARNGASLTDIEGIVARMVEEQVSEGISRAVATLEKAVAELRKV